MPTTLPAMPAAFPVAFDLQSPVVPRGYCHCGCGRRTELYGKTQRSRGAVKGQPARYVLGHAARETQRLKQPWTVDPDTSCWNWQGRRNWAGYGQYKDGGAHRAVYEARVGPIPAGMQLDHGCGNRACVNPDHMEVVTPAENTRRRSTMKLVPEQVAEIRQLAGSTTQRQLAVRFGVNQSQISRIIAGQRWA